MRWFTPSPKNWRVWEWVETIGCSTSLHRRILWSCLQRNLEQISPCSWSTCWGWSGKNCIQYWSDSGMDNFAQNLLDAIPYFWQLWHWGLWKLMGKLLLLIRVQLSTKVDRLWWKIGTSQTQINSNNFGLKKKDFAEVRLQKCEPDFYQSRLTLVDVPYPSKIW